MQQLYRELLGNAIQSVDEYIEECKNGNREYKHDELDVYAVKKMLESENFRETFKNKSIDKAELESIAKKAVDAFNVYNVNRIVAIASNESEFRYDGKTYKVKTIQEEIDFIKSSINKINKQFGLD